MMQLASDVLILSHNLLTWRYKMEQWLSNPIVIILVLLILILLIAWWLATRNRVPVVNCDNVLPPEDCDPNWLSGINYIPLSQLPATDCETRLLDPGVGKCTMFTYTNKGQNFTLTVEGGDAAAVQEYINAAAVYFTVKKVGKEPSDEAGLPSLTTILIETISEMTQLSEKDLRAARNQMEHKRKPATPSDILGSVTKDPAKIKQILETATSRAIKEYAKAKVDAGAIPESMTALLNEPGATFLVDPATLPHDDASERDRLTSNALSLMITLDWASAPRKELNDSYVVWFSVDPPVQVIAANATITYKPKRDVSSASSGIKATEGSMTDYFWRTKAGATDWSDSRTADVEGTASPRSMSNKVLKSEKPPDKRNYYSSVTGGSAGGKYTISGGWRQ
jgi:hypothetical protein